MPERSRQARPRGHGLPGGTEQPNQHEAVAAHGLPFDLLVRTREMPAATRLAASMPECRFVLDHLAKPPLSEPLDSEGMAAWETAIRALAMLPNVSAKICGLVTEADWNTWTTDVLRPVVDVALHAFGPNRLMFGSDWPVCLLAASYVAVSDTVRTLLAELSPSELDAVLGATAIEVYELDIERHARTNQT